jgi:hypothetical protein
MIVFSNNNFLDEYPIPESGPILTIGGARCDLKLKDGDESESDLSLSIERGGSGILVTGHGEVPVFINEEQSFEPQVVVDRDFIRILQYSIVVNDPFEA